MVAPDDGKNRDKGKVGDEVDRESVVDFNALPTEALQSYVSFYDLAPAYPPPDTSHKGASPSANGRKRKGRAASPLFTATGRKRNPDASDLDMNYAHGYNGSRYGANLDEEEPPCPPHFFDADAATTYLGQVAGHHFRNQPPPKEGEVVVGFLYKCRAKGELNRPLAHYRLRDPPSDRQQRPPPPSNRSR